MPTACVGWLPRPVFVTSTFRDTQAERDWLRDRVFPELAERLRQRRCHLEPIDLRWGVDTADVREEEKKQLLVLKVCLDEVKRSRPFLIGILGDRYGWVPPPERMEAAAREAGFDQPVTGRSVTALEIDFGVLSDAAQQKRCFFYFRDPLPYDQMPAGVAALHREPPGSDAERALAQLKQRIRDELPDRWRPYRVDWVGPRVTGLEEFGKQVLDDFWRELDAETRDRVGAPAPTWEEEERATLEQFIEDRTRGFVGRKPILDELHALALSPAREGTTWGACVTAPAGAGKSAVFAELSKCLAEERGTLALAHAAGVSPRSTQVDAMLRRWVAELAEATGEDPALGESAGAEEVENVFGRLLGLASATRRVVLLVDALNQFEPTTRAQHLTWLPKLWPPNVRFLATAIPGTASQALLERPGARETSLPALDAGEAAEIAHGFCQRYRRVLNPDVLSVLLEKRANGASAAGNALWLELAVEELNLLDADDFARLAGQEFRGTGEQKLHQLLLAVARDLPPGVEDLYGWMLERAEQLHGRAWAQSFVNLIAVSRAGWRESDFRELLPQVTGEDWDSLRFAALRRTFRAHVVQRGTQAQWDFAHEQMRRAVLARNLSTEIGRLNVHRALADHLEGLSRDDPLHESETMVHLIGANDRRRGARYYGSELTDGEATGATRVLAADILAGSVADPNPGLAWAVGLVSTKDLAFGVRFRMCNRFCFDLRDALETNGPLALRLGILIPTREALVTLVEQYPSIAGLQRSLSHSHSCVGDVLMSQGDLAGALVAYRANHAIAEGLASADTRDMERDPARPLRPAFAAHDLSSSLMRIGEVLKWQGDLAGAFDAYQRVHEILEHLATAHPRNAGWQRDLSVSHMKIGDILRIRGDFGGALEAYQKTHAILEHLVTAHPRNAGRQRDLSASLRSIGEVLMSQGDLGGALEAFRNGLTIAEKLAAADPRNVEWQRDLSHSHNTIGDVLTAQGDLGGAFEALRRTHAIRERLAAADPRNAVWQQDLSESHKSIGDVLMDQGALGGAFEAYQRMNAILEHLVTAHPRHAGWQQNLSVSHSRIGDVLLAEDDRGGALAAFQRTHAILERLAAADPDNAVYQDNLAGAHDRIGDVLKAHGDLGWALEAYRAGLKLRDRQAASDPRHADWQHNLSVSLQRIGDVLMSQGDLGGALEAYQRMNAILKHLVTAHPRHADWQHSLSVSHCNIGDILMTQGDLRGALKAFRAGLAIAERLAATDPRNAVWQHHLSVAHLKIGDLLRGQGDLRGALDAYRAGTAIAERLAAADLRTAKLQRDLSASYVKIGNVLTAQGDLGGALEAYQGSHAICVRMAAANPCNADGQHRVSLSHLKIGDVLTAQGDLGGALETYCAGLSIIERLAAANPANAEWQRVIAASHNRIGDVLRAQGDLSGALEAFRAGLEIRERLAAADPRNTEWQRNLAYAHVTIGDALSSRQDRRGALAAYETALPISERLAALDPRNVTWQNDVTAIRRKAMDGRLAIEDVAGALRAIMPGLQDSSTGSNEASSGPVAAKPSSAEVPQQKTSEISSVARRLLRFLRTQGR